VAQDLTVSSATKIWGTAKLRTLKANHPHRGMQQLPKIHYPGLRSLPADFDHSGSTGRSMEIGDMKKLVTGSWEPYSMGR